MPHAVFSVRDVSPKERFGAWKESISCIFDVETEREARRRDFDAQVEASLLGDLMLARTTSLGQSWTRSASTIARDGMDHYMIQLFVEGGMEADHRHGNASIGDRSLVVFDLSQEVISQTSDFTNLSLIIPRQALARSLNRPDDQHMRSLRGDDPLVGLLFQHMLSLEKMRGAISIPQAQEISTATVALTAACLNGSASDDAGDQEGFETARIIGVKRLIEANLDDFDLNAARIAHMAGLSRTKLYSLFEPLGGVTAYLRERRLRRALSSLTAPRNRYKAISEIAATCGFANESAFSRAFRQRFDCSPSEMRRRDVGAPMTSHFETLKGRRYEHWLHHL
ncbi:helix-turn-helix domain-containing protein [Fulvimarina manganoxydans]|uniref:helix-turn-helix domain-containing protein n=1 Tax=Fulvimarina manganoxydans TaxID=937218 RepID=UPI00111C7E15|nr:helix-turn-helix domain-containing protein [Fulvimarina manganoxydans]